MTIYQYLQGKIKTLTMSGDEAHGCCPFHNDEKRSFSMNIRTGLWKCFAGCGGGNLAQFVERKENVPWEKAEKIIKENKLTVTEGDAVGGSHQGTPGASATAPQPIPLSIIEEKHTALLLNPKMLSFLKEQRGWSTATIKRFQLGWDGSRVWIPIKEGEAYVNVRKYDVEHKNAGEYKVISYAKGYGKARLFPLENMLKDPILLVEGEPDCLLALQMGYNAVTCTTGADSFPKDLIALFEGKTVHICYDNDKAGKAGAKKVAALLSGVAAATNIVTLPVEQEKEDFTDYIVKYKAVQEDIDKLLVIPVPKEPSAPVEEGKKSAPVVSLEEATSSKHFYKEVTMHAMVSGKDLAPYYAPKKVHLTCAGGQKKCLYCPIHECDGTLIMHIPHNDKDLLALIDCTQEMQTAYLKRKAEVHNCNLCKVQIMSVWNIEEARVIPELDFSVEDKPYVARRVFSLGESIRANKSYKLTGLTLPHPKNQYVTHIIYDKKPLQDSLENFALDAAGIKALKVFQPKSPAKINEKISEITRDLTYNVTHMYKREDLITAIDLVYHSPTRFRFMGKDLTRGWAECLIIGDTRTGKSETLKTLMAHYRAGELVAAENTTYAGLVGGMQQSHDKWTITWGKLPLNDRRLVGIDEASGMALEQLSALSGLRSSGVAEIIKIQTERTHARTRLVWLSNTKHGRQLNAFNYGVTSIKELIGKLEDIARFDFAVTCSTDEVDQREIHLPEQPKVEHIYTTALCNKLVLWAWSRNLEHIRFTADAERKVLSLAMDMGRKYSSAIPLVEPSEQRIKIARLSAALAARLFSTKDGVHVIVAPEHVEYVVEFLERCYDKRSMGYDVFSASQGHTEILFGAYETLKREFVSFGDWGNMRSLLLEYQLFRKTDLMDQVGYTREEAVIFFKWLGKNRLVHSTSNGYVKSPAFTAFLKKIGDDKSVKDIAKTEDRI